MVEYSYDAWGNVLLISGMYCDTLGVDNPIRYRGYYYDFETDFYYLQSRYYDPAMGRFINADDTSMIAANGDFASYNLYAYCGNNPVARRDDGGEFWNFVIGGVVGGLIGGISAAINSYKETGKVNIASTVIGVISGAASGVVAASGLGMFAQAGISAGISALSSTADQVCNIIASDELTYKDFDGLKVLKDGINGGVSSLAGSITGNAVGRHITKTSVKADISYTKYLGKQFTAGIRKSAGKSSSSLIRQANNYLSKTKFYDNVTRGVSSAVGSVLFGW